MQIGEKEKKKDLPYANRVGTVKINFLWTKGIAEENQSVLQLLCSEFWREFGF